MIKIGSAEVRVGLVCKAYDAFECNCGTNFLVESEKVHGYTTYCPFCRDEFVSTEKRVSELEPILKEIQSSLKRALDLIK